MMTSTHADRVREHARLEYFEPARRRHESTIRIVAGDVQKAVRLSNRVSLVCQALKSHKFLDENHLVLEKWDGPPSGMSTTVAFTYRLAEGGFQSLGGGEAFIRKEREEFYGPGEDR